MGVKRAVGTFAGSQLNVVANRRDAGSCARFVRVTARCTRNSDCTNSRASCLNQYTTANGNDVRNLPYTSLGIPERVSFSSSSVSVRKLMLCSLC